MNAAALLIALLQAAAPPPSAPDRAAADLLAFQADKRIPGLSVAVGKDGVVVWAAAFGVRDLATRQPVDSDSVFPLGSTSKALTSLTLGMLLDDGTVALDTPIQRWLPDLPIHSERPITLRHLASHQAGLRDYDHAAGEYDNVCEFRTVGEAVAVFRSDPLLHPPGSKYEYSAYNFVLLSEVLEAASGRDFLSLVRERLTVPLGLVDTGPNQRAAPHPNLVTGYEPGLFGVPVAAPSLDVSNKWAAGGFVSTPSEMARLGLAVLAGQVVSRPVFDELTRVQPLADGSASGVTYALGWRSGLWRDVQGHEHRVVHHGGVARGGLSFFVIFPDDGLVVSLLGNLRFEPFGDFADAAFRVAETFLPGRSAARNVSAGERTPE